MYICIMGTLRLQILEGTKFSVFGLPTFRGYKLNFSDLYISFGANGIIFSDFRSILVMLYI